MKRLAIAAAILALASSASAQSSGHGMGLYSGIYQGQNPHRYCDELCRAKCDATWRFSRFRNAGVGACYAHWDKLNATPERARECEKAHHSGQRSSACRL
jgi:hypothetical protein